MRSFRPSSSIRWARARRRSSTSRAMTDVQGFSHRHLSRTRARPRFVAADSDAPKDRYRLYEIPACIARRQDPVVHRTRARRSRFDYASNGPRWRTCTRWSERGTLPTACPATLKRRVVAARSRRSQRRRRRQRVGWHAGPRSSITPSPATRAVTRRVRVCDRHRASNARVDSRVRSTPGTPSDRRPCMKQFTASLDRDQRRASAPSRIGPRSSKQPRTKAEQALTHRDRLAS